MTDRAVRASSRTPQPLLGGTGGRAAELVDVVLPRRMHLLRRDELAASSARAHGTEERIVSGAQHLGLLLTVPPRHGAQGGARRDARASAVRRFSEAGRRIAAHPR